MQQDQHTSLEATKYDHHHPTPKVPHRLVQLDPRCLTNMTNKRIPDLTVATAPLAGTELVPLWDGTSTKKVTVAKILTPATGNGVDFSAVTPAAGMTSKVLTNYEEGTFTPTAYGQTTAGVTTYTTQTGKYTRIGRQVTCIITVAWSAATGTGVLRIGGLPFTCGTDASNTFYNNLAGELGVVMNAQTAIYTFNAIGATGSVTSTFAYFV